MPEQTEQKVTLSIAPHVHSGARTDRVMLYVIIALLPAMIFSIVMFGKKAAAIYFVTVASCIIFEAGFSYISKRPLPISDFSAVVTGILLAMTLPVSTPLWVAVIGAFVAIVVAKQVFGGIGQNPFNPALVARIFLIISFPTELTNWDATILVTSVDSLSGATLLGSAKTFFQTHGTLSGFEMPNFKYVLLGFKGGSIGETGAPMLILGGFILLFLRVITWHIPVAFLGTVFVLMFGHSLFHPNEILPITFQMVSGGLLLGAFFMATDYSSSPMYPKAKLLFGFGCGVLTVVIRIYGGYPEGVAFAILIMNATVPLMDKFMRPKIYGEQI